MVSHSDTEINFSARCDFEVHDKVTIASGQIRSTERAEGRALICIKESQNVSITHYKTFCKSNAPLWCKATPL